MNRTVFANSLIANLLKWVKKSAITNLRLSRGTYFLGPKCHVKLFDPRQGCGQSGPLRNMEDMKIKDDLQIFMHLTLIS